MGQPITVTVRPGVRSDVRHFELNRSLTGMQTHRYHAGQEISGTKPPGQPLTGASSDGAGAASASGSAGGASSAGGVAAGGCPSR